jgi:hypothetical protein
MIYLILLYFKPQLVCLLKKILNHFLRIDDKQFIYFTDDRKVIVKKRKMDLEG